jgi:hypothetical protein
VGIDEELRLTETNIALHNIMDELGIDHVFETYDGTHVSHLYDRIGRAPVYASKQVKPPYNK